jgi:hypothetical protein
VTSGFVRGVVVEATSHGPFSNPRALYSAQRERNVEVAYGDYRSVDDVDVVHHAGCRWGEAVPVGSVRISFRRGYEPRIARLLGCVDGEWVEFAASRPPRTWTVAVGRSLTGVRVEQAAGGGSAPWPGVLRIESLAVEPAQAAPRLAVKRSGRWIVETMPLAFDGDPHTLVDLSDAEAIRIAFDPPREAAGVAVELLHLGHAGTARVATEWVGRTLPGGVRADGEPLEVAGAVDPSEEGVAAGTVAAAWRWPARRMEELEIVLPLRRPYVLFARAIRILTEEPLIGARTAVDEVEADGSPTTPGDLVLSASLGCPGFDQHVGVLPGGGVTAPADGIHVRALRLAWRGDGPASRELDAGGRRLTRTRADGFVQRIEVLPGPVGEIHTRSTQPIELGVTLRDGAWQVPVRWRLDGGVLLRDGLPVLAAEPAALALTESRDEVRLRWDAGEVVVRLLWLPPGAGAGQAVAEDLGRTSRIELGPRGQSLVASLLGAAAGFVGDGGTVAYGRHPSVYDGEVFGLEEDWLLRGLAQWGCATFALSSWTATTLTDDHLDVRHPLHDLRRVLTPWQAEQLCTLAGCSVDDAFAGDDRARLDDCIRWIREERRRTLGADGRPDADGVRIFPGLLPPHRYGGDVGFATQALYLDLMAAGTLRCWGYATGREELVKEAFAYRTLALAALEEVARPDLQPLHSGGGDPGDYHQLMAAGILAPCDVIDPGGRLWRRLRRDLEDDARSVHGLPRFDGWGGGACVDPQYAIGYLLQLLRAPARDGALNPDARERFGRGLDAAVRWGFAPSSGTAREVSPLVGRPAGEEGFLPGRRLSQSEPCIGTPGMLLQLLRGALVTELPEVGGRLGRRLRVLGGLPPAWRQEGGSVTGLPTRAGPVDLSWTAHGAVVHAPGAESVEIVGADGCIEKKPGAGS